MIQAYTETNFTAYISTEDNRIDKTVVSTQIRFLVKFINDLDGSVKYSYPTLPLGVLNRYTKMEFSYVSTPDLYSGQINLLPSGHWKYEVYEVSWIGSVVVALGTAPATELDVLSVVDTNGVVNGIVSKGILNLTEKAGTEQVQYIQRESPASTNHIYYGQSQSFSNLYSLNFDGVDDYLTLGDSSVFTPNSSGANRGFSFSFWVKLPSTGGGALISKNDFYSVGSFRYEYEIRTQFATKPMITFYGNDDVSITQKLTLDDVLVVDTWYHLAFTFDLSSTSTSIVGYLNGVQKTNGSGATYSSSGTWAAVADTAADLQLSKEGSGSNYRDCLIDEVSIFDDELSSSTMTDIYNSGTPTDLSGLSYLLGYWRNGDTAGTSVYPTIEDYSSNSNDGTMTNMDSGDIVTDVP
jgi:hypothetical protein